MAKRPSESDRDVRTNLAGSSADTSWISASASGRFARLSRTTPTTDPDAREAVSGVCASDNRATSASRRYGAYLTRACGERVLSCFAQLIRIYRPPGFLLRQYAPFQVFAISLVYFIRRSRPPAIIDTPPARETHVPSGPNFSASTNTVSAATHARFITPTTKSTSISAQQQPRQ